jgi:hypothetical protein
MTGLAVVIVINIAVTLTWAVTRARGLAELSRYQAELARLAGETQAEIRYWQEESGRAKAMAVQIARDAETWAAAWKQGRDDVFSTVPLLVAAQERLTAPAVAAERAGESG